MSATTRLPKPMIPWSAIASMAAAEFSRAISVADCKLAAQGEQDDELRDFVGGWLPSYESTKAMFFRSYNQTDKIADRWMRKGSGVVAELLSSLSHATGLKREDCLELALHRGWIATVAA